MRAWLRRTWRRYFAPTVFHGCSNWDCGPVAKEFWPDDHEGIAAFREEHAGHSPGVVTSSGQVRWERLER